MSNSIFFIYLPQLVIRFFWIWGFMSFLNSWKFQISFLVNIFSFHYLCSWILTYILELLNLSFVFFMVSFSYSPPPSPPILYFEWVVLATTFIFLCLAFSTLFYLRSYFTLRTIFFISIIYTYPHIFVLWFVNFIVLFPGCYLLLYLSEKSEHT